MNRCYSQIEVLVISLFLNEHPIDLHAVVAQGSGMIILKFEVT